MHSHPDHTLGPTPGACNASTPKPKVRFSTITHPREEHFYVSLCVGAFRGGGTQMTQTAHMAQGAHHAAQWPGESGVAEKEDYIPQLPRRVLFLIMNTA